MGGEQICISTYDDKKVKHLTVIYTVHFVQAYKPPIRGHKKHIKK